MPGRIPAQSGRYFNMILLVVTRWQMKKWMRFLAVSAAIVVAFVLGSRLLTDCLHSSRAELPSAVQSWNILTDFDDYVEKSLENALDDLEKIKWVWTLDDKDLIAPEPNPACQGTTTDPSSLQWLLDDARERLGVETTCFSTDVQILDDSEISYYLDDTILAITWKELHGAAVYTLSEVKIAHASQFRRYLTDGVYGSDTLANPSDMAIAVNAVTASNGDFYMLRDWGVNTYQGKVYNVKTIVDSCFITESGDLLFTRAGELSTVEQAQAFVDENHVRFSLAFGPVLVENGENVVPSSYPLGEIKDHYSRCALCQMDTLHYLLVAVNTLPGGKGVPTSREFAAKLISFGVEKAFSVDGGQSAAIITNDKLINRPDFGYQRQLSDIIYFATAIPAERWAGKE